MLAARIAIGSSPWRGIGVWRWRAVDGARRSAGALSQGTFKMGISNFQASFRRERPRQTLPPLCQWKLAMRCHAMATLAATVLATLVLSASASQGVAEEGKAAGKPPSPPVPKHLWLDENNKTLLSVGARGWHAKVLCTRRVPPCRFHAGHARRHCSGDSGRRSVNGSGCARQTLCGVAEGAPRGPQPCMPWAHRSPARRAAQAWTEELEGIFKTCATAPSGRPAARAPARCCAVRRFAARCPPPHGGSAGGCAQLRG